jgi:hypothetical protein
MQAVIRASATQVAQAAAAAAAAAAQEEEDSEYESYTESESDEDDVPKPMAPPKFISKCVLSFLPCEHKPPPFHPLACLRLIRAYFNCLSGCRSQRATKAAEQAKLEREAQQLEREQLHREQREREALGIIQTSVEEDLEAEAEMNRLKLVDDDDEDADEEEEFAKWKVRRIN